MKSKDTPRLIDWFMRPDREPSSIESLEIKGLTSSLTLGNLQDFRFNRRDLRRLKAPPAKDIDLDIQALANESDTLVDLVYLATSRLVRSRRSRRQTPICSHPWRRRPRTGLRPLDKTRFTNQQLLCLTAFQKQKMNWFGHVLNLCTVFFRLSDPEFLEIMRSKRSIGRMVYLSLKSVRMRGSYTWISLL